MTSQVNFNKEKAQPFTRITRYFLVKEGEKRIIVGASQGKVAGFSFNNIKGIRSTGISMLFFMRDKIKEGFKLIDSAGNDMDPQEVYDFAYHCSFLSRCFMSRFKDNKGIAFARIHESRFVK